MSKTKYAIYRGKVGLYAKEYIDTMEGCKDLLGARHIKPQDLPIVVNSAGGRCSFYPVEDNFVKIIEVDEDAEPLTREECFPKNSPEFGFGWISPEGDTYNTGFEGHYRASVMICKELGIKTYSPERTLEESGWVKIMRDPPYTPDNWKKKIYVEGLKLTKKQADTLVDLGYSTDEDFQFMLEVSERGW